MLTLAALPHPTGAQLAMAHPGLGLGLGLALTDCLIDGLNDMAFCSLSQDQSHLYRVHSESPVSKYFIYDSCSDPIGQMLFYAHFTAVETENLSWMNQLT